MGHVRETIEIQRSPEDVWALAGDPGRVGEWVPALAGPTVENGDRACLTQEGAEILERILEHSDEDRYYVSEITSSPFPLRSHTSRLAVQGHGDLAVLGCPNAAAASELVRRVASELGIAPEIETVLVEDARVAEQHRFLGSPTVRVDGRDVEPSADERTDFGLTCRVYRTSSGPSGQPGETWLREALARASSRASCGR